MKTKPNKALYLTTIPLSLHSGKGALVLWERSIMKNGEDDMAIDEVIFLGAGASAAETDGAPIQNSLLNDYFENGQDINAISGVGWASPTNK